MIARAFLALIRVYQLVLSPLKMLLPAPPLSGQGCCRFHPTCSEYAHQAIARFGAARGAWLTLKRLARCHPLCEGGVDPLPRQ